VPLVRLERPSVVVLALVVVALTASVAEAGGRRRAGKNLPRDFAWPPTAAMREAGRRCLDELDGLGVSWRPGPATRQVVTPVVLPDMALGPLALTPTFRRGPFVMDCHLARALARRAGDLVALGVVELGFSTIHDYRRIRVRRKGGGLPLSRHALGLAIDVFELGLADGRRLVIERDHRGEPLIAEVEAVFAADPFFRTPLSPTTAPRSHGDHIHLEARQGARELEARAAPPATGDRR
jgi:hypothetical protein